MFLDPFRHINMALKKVKQKNTNDYSEFPQIFYKLLIRKILFIQYAQFHQLLTLTTFSLPRFISRYFFLITT